MSDTPVMKELIAKVGGGASLTEAEAEGAFETLMSGAATPSQIGGFLMALRVRGETVSEITGAARIMRAKALTIEAPAGAVDTCGTGGDASGTYNISTAAAFAVAGCGVPVAKHGNRAASSKSGSADVLMALGVNIDAGTETMLRALRQAHICFMMAPRHHAAMKHVMPTRMELGTRTIFNLLGPLSNPAGTRRQVVGVFDRAWVEPLAQVLGRLGAEHAWVVHGSDGLDELTTTGPSLVGEWKNGAVDLFEVAPGDMGLATADPQALKGGDAQVNAQALRRILDGHRDAYFDIVALNAGAALVVGGRAPDLKQGVAMAVDSLAEGKARAALEGLVAITNGAAS